jgi:DNA-binding SARP family transcriptional activator/ABC-type glycerol-3-phosphate transport system substrate-binding protein
VRYRILGALRVQAGDGDLDLGGPRQQLVLAVLLLHANAPVSVAALIDSVWGADPPQSARKTAQVYVSRLRAVLGDESIAAEPSGYRLHVPPDALDASEFEQRVAAADDVRDDDPEQARDVLDRALGLWRGTPWGALAGEQALVADAVRLEELRLTALETRHELALATGHDRGLVAPLEVLVDRHPTRERLRGLLMVALYRDGRQAEALETYDELRRFLADELGTDPGPEIRDLHLRILRQDPGLLAAAVRSDRERPSERNPYKGLRPFGRDDAADFFGRAQLTADLVASVAERPFTAVVGPSGSGKSSAVRAGLLPALADGAVVGSDRWLVTTMVPGSHPFEELEAALLRAADGSVDRLHSGFRGDDLDLVRAVLRLAGDDGRILLVVDQFEELFTSITPDDVADRFARNLAEAAEDPHSQLTTVVTVRADFLDGPLTHPRLGGWIDRGMLTVLPLTPAELEEACVAPATAVGVGVEPELTAQLVADVASHPGALPLFQYALTEVFDARGDGPLTLAVHEQLGGLQGVLARRSEQVWSGLDAGVRDVARDVFLRMVNPGEGTDDTRRRVRRPELDALGDAASVAAVLSTFGDARLLTFDRDIASGAATVEVAHEALLEAWPRLRSWIDEARGELRLHRQLARAADEWHDAGREPGFLLGGTRLDLMSRLADDGSVSLSERERELVQASIAERAAQRRQDQERRQHERALEGRARGRLRLLVVVLAVAALAGAGLTAWALDRGARAEQARIDAVVANELTRARELTAAAVATRASDPQLSLLLGLHAVNISHLAGQAVPADTVAALHWGLQAARVPYPMRDAPAVVLDGPEGPQGIYRLELPALTDHVLAHVDRDLTTQECERWLATSSCPELPASFPDDLAWVDPEPVAQPPGAPDLAGTTVTLLTAATSEGVWQQELERQQEATGVRVRMDADDSLQARIEAGTADIIELPQPSRVADMARADELVDLGTYLDVERLRADFSPHLVALGSVADDGTSPAEQGRVFGVPQLIHNKSVIWYPATAFADAGYEVPTSWDELVALVDRMVADGHTPWCHAELLGTSFGWPGTDWIEDLVLHDVGAKVYDDWITHDIPFDDPRIRRAFRRYADLVLAPGHLHGGQAAATRTQLDVAQRPMFDDPPGCWLMHMPSFGTQWFPFGSVPGEDVGAFQLPATGSAGRDVVLGSGGFLVAVTDRPEVREALRWLIGPDWGRQLVGELPPLDVNESTWYLHANQRFPLDAHADAAEREAAAALHAALARDGFRFDGSDLMPETVGRAFWEAMEQFTAKGPGNLEEVLGHVEAAWQEHERSGAE